MISEEDKEILLDYEKLELEKKKAERQYAERQKFIDDWQEVLTKPAGRRVIWDLLGMMGFQKDLFHTDPLIMASNCGQYKMVLELLKIIEEAMPGITFRMQNEFRSSQLNKER